MSLRARIVAVIVTAVAVTAISAVVLLRHYHQGDVRGSSSVEFVPADVPPTRAPPPRQAEPVGAP